MTTSTNGSFKYRKTCAKTGDQIIRENAALSLCASLRKAHSEIGDEFVRNMKCDKLAQSLERVLKYVNRLNYMHFSQYSAPLTKMSAITYHSLKKCQY